MGARETALNVLIACRKEGAWSNGVLKEYLSRDRLDRREAALATRLCYGVLQNRMKLDFYLQQLLTGKLRDLHPVVHDILHLGLYQLYEMDKIPESAAVNESVDLAKKYCKKQKNAAGLVNGVLRNASRNRDSLKQPTGWEELYSHPAELIRLLKRYVPKGQLEPMLRANNDIPPMVVQVNTLKTTAAALTEALAGEGVTAVPHSWMENCLVLTGTGSLEQLASFRAGLFYVQDAAAKLSVLCAQLPKEDLRVLDCCAAPGGKSFAAAISMGGKGAITSCDIHSHKTGLIEAGAARLGLTNITARQQDASRFVPEWEEQMDAGPEAWDDMTQEEYQTGLRRKIEKAKESYKTAPETEERRIADGTYDDTYVAWSKTDCKTVVAQNQNRWFTVYSYENGNWDSQFKYTRFPFFSVMNMAHYDENIDLPEGLRYADAKAEAETVLAAIGEPFAIAAVYRVGDAADNSGNDSLKSGTHYALRFDCVRNVNDVPLAVDTSDFGSSDGSSYSIPWKQESLRIIVDADGIVSVDWGGPLAVLDSVAEAATLMPFEKISGIAEKMLPIIYNPTGWVETEAMEINVCSARLELIRVREQNNTKELQGMLVPAWVFYGTIEAKKDYATETMYEGYGIGGGTPFYNGDTIILCINAIDGSIIDPMLGY